MTEPEVNPTVARRELAVYFRRLREQRGRSPAELGALLGVTQSQVSRLDTGARGFSGEDVRRLAEWYGLGGGEQRRLLTLAEHARRRAWWQKTDLPDPYRALIGFEQAAESICEFCNTVVPGLLQTAEYATAVAEIGKIGNRPYVTEDAVAVRLRRQQILHRTAPPSLSVIIDEVVLARNAGGRRVMRDQLERLLDYSHRPKTEVRVINFEAGMYPTVASQFILLDMGSRLPAVYYYENQLSGFESTDEDLVRSIKGLWRTLEETALTQVESIELIKSYRSRLD